MPRKPSDIGDFMKGKTATQKFEKEVAKTLARATKAAIKASPSHEKMMVQRHAQKTAAERDLARAKREAERETKALQREAAKVAREKAKEERMEAAKAKRDAKAAEKEAKKKEREAKKAERQLKAVESKKPVEKKTAMESTSTAPVPVAKPVPETKPVPVIKPPPMFGRASSLLSTIRRTRGKPGSQALIEYEKMQIMRFKKLEEKAKAEEKAAKKAAKEAEKAQKAAAKEAEKAEKAAAKAAAKAAKAAAKTAPPSADVIELIPATPVEKKPVKMTTPMKSNKELMEIHAEKAKKLKEEYTKLVNQHKSESSGMKLKMLSIPMNNAENAEYKVITKDRDDKLKTAGISGRVNAGTPEFKTLKKIEAEYKKELSKLAVKIGDRSRKEHAMEIALKKEYEKEEDNAELYKHLVGDTVTGKMPVTSAVMALPADDVFGAAMAAPVEKRAELTMADYFSMIEKEQKKLSKKMLPPDAEREARKKVDAKYYVPFV